MAKPGRDALMISLLMERSSPADRKHLLRILRRAFGEGKEHKGLDPNGNPEDLNGKRGKIHKVMSEFKHGTLHSGSKHGPKVTSRKQAIAIAMSEQRKRNRGGY